MVLRGLAEHWRAVVAHGTAARVQKKLRRILYDQVASLGPGTVGRQRSGGLTLSLIDGVEQLETYFGQFLPQFLIALLSPILIFAVVAFIDLPVATVMLGFALFALFAPALWHKWDVKNSQAPADGLCLVRRRVPRFDPGPGHAEGVRPGQDARRQARGRGARPVPPHHVGAGHQLAGARHHRRLDRRRRGGGADLRRHARRGRRDVAVGPADHPDAGHRNLPADARAAHACCTRAWSACRRRRASIASSTTSPLSPTQPPATLDKALAPTIEFEDVRFAYPGTRRTVHDGALLPCRGRRAAGPGRAVGRRQVVDRAPAAALLRSRPRPHPAGRPRPAHAALRRDPRP